MSFAVMTDKGERLTLSWPQESTDTLLSYLSELHSKAGQANRLNDHADQKEDRGIGHLAYPILWSIRHQGSRKPMQERIVSSQLLPLQHTDISDRGYLSKPPSPPHHPCLCAMSIWALLSVVFWLCRGSWFGNQGPRFSALIVKDVYQG